MFAKCPVSSEGFVPGLPFNGILTHSSFDVKSLITAWAPSWLALTSQSMNTNEPERPRAARPVQITSQVGALGWASAMFDITSSRRPGVAAGPGSDGAGDGADRT